MNHEQTVTQCDLLLAEIEMLQGRVDQLCDMEAEARTESERQAIQQVIGEVLARIDALADEHFALARML